MNTSNKIFKSFKPHTPSMRQTRLLNRDLLIKNKKPLKKLNSGFLFGNGRNNTGRITSWHKGGGHKRLYRRVDFFRSNSRGLIEEIEYDPNRTSWILRLFNPDSHIHSYILGIKTLNKGNLIHNNYKTKTNLGDHFFLQDVPSGFVIHNLSTGQAKRGQYLRAAGTYGQLIVKTSKHARIKLRSGEHRLFSIRASATLGTVSNEDSKFVKLGKAGRNRWYGLKPRVRGVAINPIDHPHGGGEGKTSGGRPSVTPWGKPSKGQPTVRHFNSFRVKLRKNQT